MCKAEEFVPVFKNDVIIYACGSLREFELPDIHKVKCYNVVILDIGNISLRSKLVIEKPH